MLELKSRIFPFERYFASYLTQNDLCVRYDNLHYTSEFASLPRNLMKFYIRAEFLDTKLLVFTLPKASRANTNVKIYL